MKQLVAPLLCAWLCGVGMLLPGAPAVAQDTEHENADVFSSIGRWIDRSLTSIGDQFKNVGKGFDDFNQEAGLAAKTTAGAAADAVTKIQKTRIVSGHQDCPVADNGAPDCTAAAERLCKAKGLKGGTSLDITSARECPTRALLQRDARAECKNVTFVTRAMCQ